MADVTDYTDLITSEHQDKPNFIALVEGLAAPYVQVINLLQSLTTLFDVQFAVGQQLDVIGQWVGISRNVAIPITGVYFTWDGLYTVGFDYGSWQPSDLPTSITSLPDDAYRILIQAKIAANGWDGTTEGAYKIWSSVFSQFTILIQDYQNMTYALAIVGGIVDSLTLALLTGGYLPLRPEGVRIVEYFVPVDSNPLFAWDTENSYLGGWNSASWAREIIS